MMKKTLNLFKKKKVTERYTIHKEKQIGEKYIKDMKEMI